MWYHVIWFWVQVANGSRVVPRLTSLVGYSLDHFVITFGPQWAYESLQSNAPANYPNRFYELKLAMANHEVVWGFIVLWMFMFCCNTNWSDSLEAKKNKP